MPRAGRIAIAGRLGGRRADGRGGQFRPRTVGRGRRRRAVRRRAQHDARRQPAADPRRMARMGQSDRGQGRVRPDPQLFALRQCRGPGLSADADHRRPQRPARDLLGAGQMGREAARDQDRRQYPAAQDQHGRGPWRQVRPLGAIREQARSLSPSSWRRCRDPSRLRPPPSPRPTPTSTNSAM